MKKYLFLSLGVIFAFGTIISGCSDTEEQIETQLEKSFSTRSISATDYYWNNGEKITIKNPTMTATFCTHHLKKA